MSTAWRFKTLVSAALTAALMTAGCIPASTVKKDNTFQGKQITLPALGDVSVVADLEVAERKVMGKAFGDYSNRAGVESAAVDNAFAQDPAGPNSADVLVAPSFFYEYNMDEDAVTGTVTVTVVGYPARYKNFRSGPKLESGGEISAGPTPEAYQESAIAPTPEAYQAPATPAPVNAQPPVIQQTPNTNVPKE